jgi:cytochrome c oxidase accessory protein FixG
MSERARRSLPVLAEPFVSSIDPRDGTRRLPVPADVRGSFASARKVVFALLVAFWIAAPLARIGGRPVVLLEVERRRFFLFGESFGVADVHLLFFVLTGGTFALVVLTAVLGRVWCGWLCPQTVFLEGIFRPIERLVEGGRERRLRRDRGPWTAERVLRKVGKHALFVAASAIVAHATMSLFVSWPGLLAMVKGPPGQHPEAFAWAAASTGLIYGNFAFFREQLCLVLCPYGRLQGVLVDDATVNVGYDERRGEPRGKATDPTAGDCVDCKRCVAVCPTGIDIRNGLQLDCIGCTACIDACDEVMDKLERPRGLIRYDSKQGFAGERRRVVRPRLAIYAALGVLGLAVATFVLWRRDDVGAQLLRAPGAPFVVEGDRVRNAFVLQITSRRDAPVEVLVDGRGEGLAFVLPDGHVAVEPMGQARVTVVVTAPRGTPPRAFSVEAVERRPGGDLVHRAEGRFVSGRP